MQCRDVRSSLGDLLMISFVDFKYWSGGTAEQQWGSVVATSTQPRPHPHPRSRLRPASVWASVPNSCPALCSVVWIRSPLPVLPTLFWFGLWSLVWWCCRRGGGVDEQCQWWWWCNRPRTCHVVLSAALGSVQFSSVRLGSVWFGLVCFAFYIPPIRSERGIEAFGGKTR